jgi:hypothetical protein
MRSLISWHSLQLGQRAVSIQASSRERAGAAASTGCTAAGVAASFGRLASWPGAQPAPGSRAVPAPGALGMRESCTPPCSCRRRHSSRQRRVACISRASTITPVQHVAAVDGQQVGHALLGLLFAQRQPVGHRQHRAMPALARHDREVPGISRVAQHEVGKVKAQARSRAAGPCRHVGQGLDRPVVLGAGCSPARSAWPSWRRPPRRS